MRQVLVIDDLRRFRVRPADATVTYARTSKEGLKVLAEQNTWDEIWLDHDLGGDDIIIPVVTYMEEQAFNAHPVEVGQVFVHTSNPYPGEQMVKALNHYGYNVKRAIPEKYFIV